MLCVLAELDVTRHFLEKQVDLLVLENKLTAIFRCNLFQLKHARPGRLELRQERVPKREHFVFECRCSLRLWGEIRFVAAVAKCSEIRAEVVGRDTVAPPF